MDDLIFSLTLKDIYKYDNKEKVINEIVKNLQELGNNRFLTNLLSYKIFNKQLQQIIENNVNHNLLVQYPISLKQIYKEYEDIYFKNTSLLFFPNQLVAFYPRIKLSKSKNEIRCHFNGLPIKKNELYLSYRPLLENLYTKESFVLENTIKVNLEYEESLPSSIQEFEYLYEHFKNSNLSDINDIYFDEFRAGYTFSLLKLKKKR